MTYRLGRKPPEYAKPRLWAEDYYKVAQLPAVAPMIDYYSGVAYPMYLNDRFGDCTIAGIAHVYNATSQFAQGTERQFQDAVIQTAYMDNCPGFNPATDANDDGCTLQAVLAWNEANGLIDTTGAVNTVTAYAQLKGMGSTDLNIALQLYGAVYCGVNLPQSAETQFPAPWTYVKGSPILGGHCIVLAGMNAAAPNPYTFVTWGATVQASQEWVATYLEEAWVALTPDFLTATGGTLTGVDTADLMSDMQEIA
jgi:hypothetical protein